MSQPSVAELVQAEREREDAIVRERLLQEESAEPAAKRARAVPAQYHDDTTTRLVFRDGTTLMKLLVNATKLSTSICIDITKDAMLVRQMYPPMLAAVAVTIGKDAFDLYTVDAALSVTLFAKQLTKVASLVEKNEIVEIIHRRNRDADKILIRIVDDAQDKVLRLDTTSGAAFPRFNVHKFPHATRVTLPSTVFRKWVADATKIGATTIEMDVTSVGDKHRVIWRTASNGDGTTQNRTRLLETMYTVPAIRKLADTAAVTAYSMPFLSLVTGFCAANVSVEIGFNNDAPMSLVYAFGKKDIAAHVFIAAQHGDIDDDGAM